MTDTEIIEKLATEVMGWEKGHNVVSSERTVAFWQVPNGSRIFDWNPLKDMNDAWMIVHKLWHEDGRTIWVGPDTVDGGYAAQYRPDQKSMLVDFMREETAPRAICYAALKAKGIEI